MTPARAFKPLRDFAPVEPAAVEAAPQAPMIEEAEANARLARAVEEAKREAFAQGEAAGRAEAEETLQAAMTTSLKTLQAQLDDLFAKEDAVLREVEVRAVRLILSVAQKLTTELSDAEAEKFAAAVARRAIDAAQGAPSVEIRVSEELLSSISDALSGALSAAIQSGRATITPDASLNRASVYVAWNCGSVAFDPSAMEGAIDKIISEAMTKLGESETPLMSQEKTDEQ